MAIINFDIDILSTKIKAGLELTGQDLYYFNQSSPAGKMDWLRSHAKGLIKISNIEESEGVKNNGKD